MERVPCCEEDCVPHHIFFYFFFVCFALHGFVCSSVLCVRVCVCLWACLFSDEIIQEILTLAALGGQGSVGQWVRLLSVCLPTSCPRGFGLSILLWLASRADVSPSRFPFLSLSLLF